MATEELLSAIGTLHCPHCHLPLFANPLAQACADVTAARGSFMAPFIYVADNAFADSASLVKAVEALPLWAPAAVIGGEGARYGARRRNEFLPLTGQAHPALERWGVKMRDIFHAAAHTYATGVDHLTVCSDLGYQVLRYPPGEEFLEHVDTLPGSTVYGQRQLTAILYLNDDFDGGELTRPQQGLVYNPRAGSLLLFPSGFLLLHSSRPVAIQKIDP